VAGKESAGNMHRRLCAVYGSCAIDRSTVGRWVQRVKVSGIGETELHDRPRYRRPATTISPDMLQGADDIIYEDRLITSRKMAVQLSVSNGNATNSARQCPSLHKSMNPGGNRQIWLHCAPSFPYSPDLAPSYFHLLGIVSAPRH
jgi:hypothetical protein